jgi:hypothetical protein
MRATIPYYPSGAPGAGLVLLRLAVAHGLLLTTSPENAALWQKLVFVAVSLGLVGGFNARLLSILCLLFELQSLFGSSSLVFGNVTAILSASALALVGPGAFSIDARLFGHRTVQLPNVDVDSRS